MKRIISLIIILLISLFLGCSDKKVEAVKNGVLNFDKTLTVGEAFDNYKYCKDVKWESFTTDNGRDVVQVTCDYDLYNTDNSSIYRNEFKKKGIVKAEITYQFDLLKPDYTKFQLRGEFVKFLDKNGKVVYSNDRASLLGSLKDLKLIYENKPLL